MQKRKTTILILCPYPPGQAPSQRFRFEQYLDSLREVGIEFELRPFFDEPVWQHLYAKGKFLIKVYGLLRGLVKRLFTLIGVGKYDFVFIHREAAPIGPPFIEWVISKVFSKKIIYDFDDAIWLPNTSDENKVISALKWHSKVKAICRWSHVISCGNTYLCDYASQYNPRVVLNPTTIDTNKLHNPGLHPSLHNSDGITLGWTGSHSTLKYLEGILPVVKMLEQEFPEQFKFVVVADKRQSFSLASLHFIPWNRETEIKDLVQFDIGLMPLTDDVWSQGKCGLKALQYMSLGIPTVASAVGVNRSILDHGVNGYLCSSEADWKTSLMNLIRDPSMRRKMGLAAREKVISNYSVDSNKEKFLSLFS